MKKLAVKKRKKQREYQIFVSHSTTDKWIAEVICEKLDEVGANTFRDDRDIDGGDDIPERIRMEIKRSDELLVLLTPHSVASQWVLLEVGAAWGTSIKRRITVVRYHVEVDLIPEILKSKKSITLNELEHYFLDVRRRLQRKKR